MVNFTGSGDSDCFVCFVIIFTEVSLFSSLNLPLVNGPSSPCPDQFKVAPDKGICLICGLVATSRGEAKSNAVNRHISAIYIAKDERSREIKTTRGTAAHSSLQ